MIRTKCIKIMVTTILLLAGSSALAMTPGSSMSYWQPAKIHQLSPSEVQELNAAQCLVISYRSDDDSVKKNVSGEPDEQDSLMLVRGEFAAKGQKDLLVLCKSSKNKAEFLKLIWGGIDKCPNEILMSKVSNFWNKRDPSLDWYGSNLEVFSPLTALKFMDKVRSSGLEQQEVRWMLKKDDFPKLEHDSIGFFGNYSFMFYCSGHDWIKLYDSYSTYVD